MGPEHLTLSECLGKRRTGKLKQQPLSLTDIPEQKGISPGREDARAAGERAVMSAASRFTQAPRETAPASVSAEVALEPQAAAGQPLLAGKLGRGRPAFSSLWILGSPPSPCRFPRPWQVLRPAVKVSEKPQQGKSSNDLRWQVLLLWQLGINNSNYFMEWLWGLKELLIKWKMIRRTCGSMHVSRGSIWNISENVETKWHFT